MKKAEKWTPPEPQTIDEFATDDNKSDHGTGGSIRTTANANYTDLIPQYLDSLENLSGVPRNLAPVSTISLHRLLFLHIIILAWGKYRRLHVCHRYC